MTTPKIIVVMPAYNAETTIEKTYRETIDVYLAMCDEDGVEPEKPLS